MLGYGYFLSASGPLLVGALYQVTGGFLTPVLVLAVLGTGSGLLALARELRPGDSPVARSPVAPAA
jgi:cyanate permease